MKENIRYNYFIITNTFVQSKVSEKLISEYNFENDFNICFHRYNLFKGHCKIKEGIFKKVYGVPSIESKLKIILWLNFFIYIFYFSIFFLSRGSKGNLVIGNLLFHGSRFICNFYSKFWKRIFVLDEGTSTLNIYKNRSKLGSKIKFHDRLLFTFQPENALTFYTIFNLTPNSHDEVHYITNIFKINQNVNGSASKSLLFIGTDLVESKIISKNYFNVLLKKLRSNNPGITITYVPHPRERYIYESREVRELAINIYKPDVSIEEYLLTTRMEYDIIGSCISTGYIYAQSILGKNVSYQTYLINNENVIGEYNKVSCPMIYGIISEKFKGFNHKKIII